ncbi:MAG: cupin domain-containing protein [Bdellovibrionota bacterium]
MSGNRTKITVERTDKPWGHELLWGKTQQYVGKLLFIKAGESLSLQYHKEKEETIFLESGEMQFECGPSESDLQTITLLPGEGFHIPPGYVHRMIAVKDCRVFEVSTPQLHDVVRLKDRYGRTPN